MKNFEGNEKIDESNERFVEVEGFIEVRGR